MNQSNDGLAPLRVNRKGLYSPLLRRARSGTTLIRFDFLV